MHDIKSFCREARNIVGDNAMIAAPEALCSLAANTLGLERALVAAVYPESTTQVADLIRLARRTGVPLYPVSRGKNVGYGDRTPVADGHALVELSRMRAITDYDPEMGTVRIEAGVSQGDLYEFLLRQGDVCRADATGAGLDASIVGNTLEGGFGHTPLGNHREAFSDAEIVLGNGEIFTTGRFPGLGPDIKGLFVQSNFGVVTAMHVPLMPIPEHFESFALRCDAPDALPAIVDTLRRLRQENVLASCVHIANPVRYLVSSRPCPPEFRTKVITDDEARRIMSSRLLPVGHWNAAGGLYGRRGTVTAHKQRLTEAFRHLANLHFFSDAKLAAIEKYARKGAALGIPGCARIHDSIVSFGHIHRLMQGIPTDEPYRNILWRVDSRDKLGLIWFAPTKEARGRDAARILALAAPLFERHGFEMPLTITLVSDNRLVAVFNIVFDKTVSQEKVRAWELYTELREVFAREGVGMYRSSILHMENLRPDDLRRGKVLDVLKTALDPDDVMAQGRYGIARQKGAAHATNDASC